MSAASGHAPGTTPQIQVRFVVTGDPMDHDVVSKAIDLAPTSTMTTGAPTGTAGRRQLVPKVSRWVHSLPAVESYSARDQVRLLLDQLLPRQGEIRSLGAAGLVSSVRVVVVLGDVAIAPPPDLGLDLDLIEAMAVLGADLDVDMYDHGYRDLLNQPYPM